MKTSRTFRARPLSPRLQAFGLAALGVSLAPLPSVAEASAAPAHQVKQRALYQQALAARNANRLQEFKSLTARLKDYPLYPYLKLQEYALHLGPVSFGEAKAFAVKYEDSPAGLRMSHAWLRAQASEGDWATILKHSAPGQFSEEFDCIYYRAKYETGDHATAFEGAAKLWNVGYPQANACDKLFEAWKQKHPITERQALERMRKAYANNKPQLATYLERYISSARLPIVKEWRDVYADPMRVVKTERYFGMGNAITPVLATGLEKIAQKDPHLAGRLWKTYSNKFEFSREEKQRVLLQISRFMMVNFEPDAEYWLNAALAVDTPDIVPIGLRSAIRQQDWERAERWLSAASDYERNQLMWQYWRARTDQWLEDYYSHRWLTQTPRYPLIHDDWSVLRIHRDFMAALADPYRLRETFPARVKALIEDSAPPATAFELLAKNRSFYGFMASTRIGAPLPLNSTRYYLDNLREVVRKSPSINRVLEFQALGMEADARRELFHAVKHVTEDEKIAGALIAHKAGWHLHAILLAQQSAAQNDLSIRFPVLYTNMVKQYANDAGITPEWTYAVIRQESAFWQEARSPVGAQGYMQLMPATAQETARFLGIRVHPSQVMQPETNIRLGTTYLGRLLRQLDGNAVLATAAYNAGAGRARKWQPRDTPMPGDIWIETIPFTETREYVKNVMTYQAIYQHNLGKIPIMAKDTAYIPPLRSR